MKNLILIALLACISLCANAQLSKQAPQPDSLIKIINDGRHQLYTIGGKLVTPAEVRLKLISYPPSAAEYNLAKRNAVWAYSSLGASGIFGIAALIDFAHSDKISGATLNNNGSITYQQHSHTGAYILTGASTAFLFSSVYNIIRGAHHGKKSLYLYNQRFQ